MRTRWSTLADTVGEVEVLGNTRGDAHAVVDILANTLEKLEALCEKWGETDTLVDTLAEREQSWMR